MSRHCERSEAIQPERHGRNIILPAPQTRRLDCFAYARNDGLKWLLILLFAFNVTACGHKAKLKTPAEAAREEAKKKEKEMKDDTIIDDTQ